MKHTMRRPRRIELPSAALAWQRQRNEKHAAAPGSARPWYTIRNATGPGPAVIAIYDEIGYWGVNAATFVEELADLAGRALEVRLNSPGGDVFEGIAIYNALLNHPQPVTCHVDGLAASIASVILQAGDQRVMAKASQIMIHRPTTGAYGDRDDLAAAVSLLDGTGDMLAEVYADRAGGEPADWLASMVAVTWYHSAEQAISAGLADSIAGAAATEDRAGLDVGGMLRDAVAAAYDEDYVDRVVAGLRGLPADGRPRPGPQTGPAESEHDRLCRRMAASAGTLWRARYGYPRRAS